MRVRPPYPARDLLLMAATEVIPSVLTDEPLSAISIVPSVFDAAVAPAVAEAVAKAASRL